VEACIEQDAYVLASAMLGYQVDKNIKLQFNIDNIFDEKYYEGIGENSMNWGTPRNATLSVRYNF
jgi:outer membrane receptor for ferric coprogen and ferric-rhodotorulic acid